MFFARRRRHVTQKDLASRMGTRVNTLRRMEVGHPGLARVHFARALQLFGEIDNSINCLQIIKTPSVS
jgi:transcriptional regulator with XRE-family HTH domain